MESKNWLQIWTGFKDITEPYEKGIKLWNNFFQQQFISQMFTHLRKGGMYVCVCVCDHTLSITSQYSSHITTN